MITPNNPLQEQGTAAQQLVERASAFWVKAGYQSDSAEGLGADGRIALVHGLVDLWVKSYIALLEGFIAGPGSWLGSGQASEPVPSEVIDVAPRQYPREITIDAPFVRLGLPTVTMPKSAIAFQPPFLPAGITQFRIVLKDYRFIGANYTGKITLTTQPAAGLKPQDLVSDEQVVTVGL